MDALVLSRYPFLSAARNILARNNAEPTREDLERGRNRVLASIARGISKNDAFSHPAPQTVSQNVLSYAIARMLLSAAGSEYYWRAFAKGEARQAIQFLAENPGELVDVARDFFPKIEFNESGDYSAKVQVIEYLSQNAENLSKRSVTDGRILLSQGELLDVIRNVVYRKARLEPRAREYSRDTTSAAASLREELREKFPPIERKTYSGKYLALPCIQKMLSGVPEGRRYYASMSLAIACKLDGLSLDESTAIMQSFVEANPPSQRPFTTREALASRDWAYKRNINFSCKYQREHGLADLPECSAGKCPITLRRPQAKPPEKRGPA